MSTLLFRRAAREDLPKLIEMLADDVFGREREIVADPPAPAYTAAFDAIAADPNQFLAVVELDGEIVGQLQLSFLPGLSHQGAWRGQIEGVRVASHLRGKGVGAQIIEWAVAHCAERGCRFVQLTSNNSRTEAHRFYTSLGFEATHTGFKRSL